MDFTYTPQEEAFRQAFRAWLEPNLCAHREQWGEDEDEFTQHPSSPASMAWHKRLYDGGWVGLHWPTEYGGRGATQMEQVIFTEESMRLGAPPEVNGMGINMVGPMLMHYGTVEQRTRYLRKILRAEEIWCQGFSEPGSGSDLASLKTRAELRGDRFVVDGQKVWSSFAHVAEQCILLTRSDARGEKHEGLTYLIVDMKSPGVEVRPLRQITGEAEFNEIFFTGVEVPRQNLLGEIGGGWRVAMTTLLHERGTFGVALAGALQVAGRKLVALARERAGADARVRDRVAREWSEVQALRYTDYRALAHR